MNYDDVVAAMFTPSPPDAVAGPTVGASPARRLRDAIEPIAMHSVWSRQTCERLAELGLDFFGSYVWGRAAALGEPDVGVVVSSFAVFSPDLIGAVYGLAHAACPRDVLLAERQSSTVASLAAVLDGEDVGPTADALAAAVTAADGTGRPLFSGLRSQPWPDDPVGQLWRACELAREHRGDSHVAACVVRGLGPVEMNVLTELWVGMPLGSYTSTRGWSADQIAAAVEGLTGHGSLDDGGELTAAGRAVRDDIEAVTDAMEQPIVDALGRDADVVIAQLDDWSARCIAAGAFPPDVFKRAAG
ncbi:MAG: hypothetical protein ABW195_19700 [Ilumatobacteraceae bacterium]